MESRFLGDALLRRLDDAIGEAIQAVEEEGLDRAVVGVSFTVAKRDGETFVSWQHSHKRTERGSCLAKHGPRLPL